MYSNLTKWAYLFRSRKWKKQTMLSFAMELYPSCGTATSAFSELLFHEAKRPMRVPHSSLRGCHHWLLAAFPSSHAAPLNTHGRCCGNPPPHLLRESWQLVRLPWHQPHQHLDGASRPRSQIQPQLLFLCLAPLQGQQCFHDIGLATFSLTFFFPLTPSCPFLEELPHGESAAGRRGRIPPGPGRPVTSRPRLRPALPPAEGLPGRKSRPGWFFPANFSSREPRQPSRPRHVLMDGRGRRARSCLPAGPRRARARLQ